jgi:DNA-binding transcriptional regulator YhcF (GntR family)
VTAPQVAVDTASGVAPWRQVHDQIAALAAAGVLPAGRQLPTIRQLARDLGLSPGTVARAYRELEAAGVLHTARRHGTVVAAAADRDAHRADPLRQAAADYVARARALGVDLQRALAAVRAQYQPQPGRGDF